MVSGALLLLALPSGWDYFFYILLRWIICGSSIYMAWQAYRMKVNAWLVPFTIIAVLFNPLLPVYLSKEMWALFDISAAVVFFAAAFKMVKASTLGISDGKVL